MGGGRRLVQDESNRSLNTVRRCKVPAGLAGWLVIAPALLLDHKKKPAGCTAGFERSKNRANVSLAAVRGDLQASRSRSNDARC
jgi:hypothetical protein